MRRAKSMDAGSIYYGGKPKVSVAIQSDYRENDTQTEPWTPKFRVVNGKPEVLTLGFMKYKRDLPAWRRTTDAIEFMRKKRAWERYLAKTFTPENTKFCKRIITDIEKCEMNLMEDDFNRKNQKRLELAAKEADYFNYTMDLRFKEREQFVASEIAKRREAKIKAIRAKKTRELRKIDMKQRGVNMKYHKLTPVEEMCDPLSPFHVSVARFGKNPRYGTEILNKDCRIISMKAFKTLEDSLLVKSGRVYEQKRRPTPKKHDCSIVIEEAVSEDEPSWPSVHLVEPSRSLGVEPRAEAEEVANCIPIFLSPHQEKDYQAVLFVQTLIRGRAVQNLMYRGRKKNQASVDEIQSTVAFFKEEEDEVDLRRRRALQRLRYYHLNMKLIGLVALVQQELLGEGIADLALKSHLEVERMTEETRGYLMALLGERTRWHREAAEAGRRQRELRRRDLYNEFFRHLTRRNEITSSFYLKIIEDTVVRAIAEKEADVSTRQRADEIEKKDIEDAKGKKHDIVMRREMMARLLHDFYIPQIAKNLERYSIDYYIGKARKTAIDVITERAQPYNAILKETSLMELVKHPKSKIYVAAKPPPATPESESTEPLAFHDDLDDAEDEEEEFAKRVEFLDQFMKQGTMSVISEAETLAKEADRYKNLIMKQLRAQEEERRKSMKPKKLSTEDESKCYEHMYSFNPKRISQSVNPEEEIAEIASIRTAELHESEEDEDENEPISLPFSDVIDKRLLVNSDGDTTTDSDEEHFNQRQDVLKKYGDMPDRVVDEILIQAEVLQAKEEKNLTFYKLATKSTVDTAVSTSSELLVDATDDASSSAVVEEQKLDEEVDFEHEHDAEEIAREIARLRYLDWRDQSDLSHVQWMHQGDLMNTPVSSEGLNEEGEQEYYGEYEEDEAEYYTQDETLEEAEEEEIPGDEFE